MEKSEPTALQRMEILADGTNRPLSENPSVILLNAIVEKLESGACEIACDCLGMHIFYYLKIDGEKIDLSLLNSREYDQLQKRLKIEHERANAEQINARRASLIKSLLRRD